jgi:hypothetical protein
MNKTFIVLVLALLAFTASADFQCQAAGDPHYRTLGGKYFNFFREGTFTLYRGSGVDCKTTLKRSSVWGTNSLNAGLKCRAGRNTFVVGDHYSIVNGRRQNGNFFRWSANGVRLEVRAQRIPRGPLRYYLDIALFSKSKSGYGLCVSNTHVHSGVAKRAVQDRAGERLAARVCRHFHKGTSAYRMCFTDVAVSHRKRVAKQFNKFERKVSRDFQKICDGRHCRYYKIHHHQHRVRQAYNKRVLKYRNVRKLVTSRRRVRQYYMVRVADRRARRIYRRLAKRYAKYSRAYKRHARINWRLSKTVTKPERRSRWVTKTFRHWVVRRVPYWTYQRAYRYVTRHSTSKQMIHMEKA